MGCHSPLQGIFLVQGSNPGFLNCRWILYHLSHQESLTCAYWHLQFTRFGGQLVTVALRKSPRENIAEINYRHNPLSKSELQQVYFPHNHEGEKKKRKTMPSQDKMFSIPNYYRRNANQNNYTKSNYTSQKDHLHKSTTVNGGEGQAERGTPPTHTVGRKGHWQ